MEVYFEKRVMKKFIEKISIPLAVALIMFPQIIETMCSPALTSVKNSFRISENQAAQAMSIFFIAFAFGVVFWGRACDIIGRRPSTLLGLVVFILSAIFSMMATDFDGFLTGFGCCAFGAAVGSICTQTIIRDGYHGKELGMSFHHRNIDWDQPGYRHADWKLANFIWWI